MFQPLPGCIAAIIAHRVAGATLLDVGAGVGVVHLALLGDGAARPSTGGRHAASCTPPATTDGSRLTSRMDISANGFGKLFMPLFGRMMARQE